MNKHTAELLERHFDTAFAAPDGIKKLRELILTLAMQGKLVPQDPNDQPASELLKEIEAEKQRLVKEGKIKKPKPLQPVSEEEKPYALPQGWEWVRLGDIGLIGSSSRVHQRDWKNNGVPFYRAREIVKLSTFGFVENELFISEELYQLLSKDGLTPEANDLMITGVGTIGVPYLVKETDRFYFKDASVLIFKNLYSLCAPFLYRFFKSSFWNACIHDGSMGTTVHTLTIGRATETIIPLPSISEQHRIVAKIDELKARCDELEKLRAAQQEQRLTVHAAAIKQLLNIAEPDQHQGAQAFLAEHFGELYTVKENVAELRKAILQLAVMGKLVPQDPNDQPASGLLKEIEAEKQRLVKEGKIKKPKPLPPVSEEEKPYALPPGWEWVRLGDVSLSSDSGWSPQCNPEPRIKDNWGVLKVSAVSWGKFNPNENKALPESQNPRPEISVQAGDFLISRANTEDLVARSVVVECAPPNLMMSDKIVRFSMSGSVNKTFINFSNGTNEARSYYISRASGTSSSMKNVSREVMANLPVPLPPLMEQNRIVAKIDELMTLCDTLDQKIEATNSKQTELLNALVHAQSQAKAESPVVQPSATITNLADYRAAIGCYTLGKLANAKYFGRTAAAKVLYLAQAHVGLELNLQPEREAAGPYDPWIREFENQGQDNGWFEVNDRELVSGKIKKEYRCLPDLSVWVSKAVDLMQQGQKAEFDRLIHALADKTTEEVEIIATLFAVWNDFLIDGTQPTDEQIITDLRENWHQRKARFTPAKLGQWLGWLRTENFVPRGLLPRTVQQSSLAL